MSIRRRHDAEPIPWALLLEADPSRAAIRWYLSRGELWLAGRVGEVRAAMVLMQTRVDALEIMNIATDPEFRSRGLGTRLLDKARRRARELKARCLHVGTGNCSYRQLQFYQRFGFRICGVDRDFFVRRYRRPQVERGVVLRDMIRLETAV